ncbi:MAG TPA: DNA-formamidopyrimidine glycosylase family protein, partial [Polyangiaceae bacterium]
MPELPDITVYVERIAERVRGSRLEKVRLASPFVLRTALPPIREAEGKTVLGLSRLGKRIVFELEGDLFLVIHLMVAGRFRWEAKGKPVPGKVGLAAFDFERGTLILTEASSKKRASIHLVVGRAALGDLDRGGLELDGATEAQFVAAMVRTNHTLKRALTDPSILSGIGNAYSDEILHAARLSPLKQTKQLSDDEWTRLHQAVNEVLSRWTAELRIESAQRFPEKVTAFRQAMSVHGRYGKPCTVCGTKVQRIVYADNETNYCPKCQTGGKLLADRSMSRLLRADWPRSVDEFEEKRPAA